MDSRTQSQKQELAGKLAEYRSSLKVPDTRQIVSQSKNLLQVASKLPANIPARPARTLMITAGVSCLLLLLLKPKKRRKKKLEVSNERKSSRNQLLGFALSVSQPLVRVWLTERARRWMRK